MIELSQKKKEKLLKALEDGTVKDPTSLAVFQLVSDMEDNMTILEETVSKAVNDIKNSEVNFTDTLKSLKGKDGEQGIRGDKGDKGDKGDSGINGKDGRDGKNGKDGKNGVSPDINTIIYEATRATEEKLTPFIPKIEDIEKDLPKLGTDIRNALELLPENDKLSIDAIENLEKRLKDLERKGQSGGVAGVAFRDLVKDIDISSQLNGVLTTFNIQAVWNVISVNLSSYPYGSLRKNIDYSYTPTSITFLATIDPVTQLSAGQQCVLTVVQG